MYNGKTVSVVFPAYNEEKNIANAVKDFFIEGIVDEVIVVNNNSKDNTAAEVLKTKARLITETKQGYGHALQRGLREASGDLIITAEPDGTFIGKDVLKLLAYSDDFELVCGTRTSRELIWEEANMGWFLRVGNVSVSKLLQVLHDGPSLTDCGCTVRLIHREVLAKFIDELTIGSSHFLPEMLILALKHKVKVIEIPVNYRGRVGESKITGSLEGTLQTGFDMIGLIIGYKLWPKKYKYQPQKKDWLKWPVFWTVAISIVVMLLAGWSSLNKPFIMDEIDFQSSAQAIHDRGIPIYYRGELLKETSGLWHPPLYVFTLALWQSILGFGTVSARSLGLFLTILSLAILGLFFKNRALPFVRAGFASFVGSIPLFFGLIFVATSPIIIQGTLVLDIDTQLFPFLISAFFLELFTLKRRPIVEKQYWIIYTCSIALLFMAKLTTPVLLIPAFMIYEVFSQKRFSLNILKPLVFGLVGFFLFLLIWFIWAGLSGMDFYWPFNHLTYSHNNPVTIGGGLSGFINSILTEYPDRVVYLFQWLSPGFILIGFLILLRELFVSVDSILERPERLAIVTFITLLLLMYIVLRPAPYAFPKYYPPVVPLMGLLLIDFFFVVYKEKHLLSTTIWSLITIVIYVAYIKFRFVDTDFMQIVYTTWPKFPVFYDWFLLPLGIALAIYLAGRLVIKQKQGIPAILSAFVAVTIGWQVAVVTKQASVTYATSYYYGEAPLMATVAYLRENLPKEVVIIAPKDIGFQLQDQWRYIELTYDPRDVLDYIGVEFIVVRANDAFGNTLRNTPELRETITEKFYLQNRVDQFIILQRKTASIMGTATWPP